MRPVHRVSHATRLTSTPAQASVSARVDLNRFPLLFKINLHKSRFFLKTQSNWQISSICLTLSCTTSSPPPPPANPHFFNIYFYFRCEYIYIELPNYPVYEAFGLFTVKRETGLEAIKQLLKCVSHDSSINDNTLTIRSHTVTMQQNSVHVFFNTRRRGNR